MSFPRCLLAGAPGFLDACGQPCDLRSGGAGPAGPMRECRLLLLYFHMSRRPAIPRVVCTGFARKPSEGALGPGPPQDCGSNRDDRKPAEFCGRSHGQRIPGTADARTSVTPAAPGLQLGPAMVVLIKSFPRSGWRTQRPPLLKAFAAVYRATLCGLEGDGCLLPAL